MRTPSPERLVGSSEGPERSGGTAQRFDASSRSGDPRGMMDRGPTRSQRKIGFVHAVEPSCATATTRHQSPRNGAVDNRAAEKFAP